MTTVQIIAMVLAIFGAGGYLAYQNKILVEQMERNFNSRFEQMEKRYDDLKQVVLSDRQERKNK